MVSWRWPDMGGTVTPPVVTLFPDGTVTNYGSSSSRTFSASVTQPATITFYFDGVAQAPVDGQKASFSCVNVATHHLIRVVASNENGSSEDSCDWYVRDEPCVSPVVNRASPNTEFVCDAIGESRAFSASVTSDPDFPPTVALYRDDQFVVSAASSTLTASAGTHTVKVVAISCGMSETSWIWYVPPSPPSDPHHTSPIYQRPVVTRRSPTDTSFEYPSRMNDEDPPICVVQVNQPALLILKVDAIVVDTKEVTQVDTDITFEQGPNFISYMKIASHLGIHTLSIVAENSNGTSDPVTWQWTLIPAIAQAAIEFEIDNTLAPLCAIVGFEFESMMNTLPFHDNTGNFNSAGDYKFIIPS